MNIEITNFTAKRIDKKYFQKIGKIVLEKVKQPENAEVSLVFVGDDRIKGLNKKYRGQDKVTDVLSFPNFPQETGRRLVGKLRTRRSQPQATKKGIQFVTPEEKNFLGDIVISVPQAKKQAHLRQPALRRRLRQGEGFGGRAKQRSYPLKHELTMLFIHGILHLVGYEDETKRGYERMTKKQDEILGYLNFKIRSPKHEIRNNTE